ncbi:hypothetical protein C6988_04965 [Nitrosopumilus sp. b1]|uniref:hypothetical protein n=1 Tax=Nitrosopumilus sp. b1 TaxID=2109907 RepID=UPI0015F54319|nr:hypothetical protein [Nitrosopumilus sp. b1]KAF6243043.1 hypothetical protein C6988_04965 [Nitrosopumilus sp. b1]
MQKSRKATLLILLVVGVGFFGYSQYASASQINAIITESSLLEENERGSAHNIQLEFDNPSLLLLTAGETDFIITADEKQIGEGELQSFVLPPMSKAKVDGVFLTYSDQKSDETQTIRITGVTQYDVLFTKIDVPFVYYPTEVQAREFIHQN